MAKLYHSNQLSIMLAYAIGRAKLNGRQGLRRRWNWGSSQSVRSTVTYTSGCMQWNNIIKIQSILLSMSNHLSIPSSTELKLSIISCATSKISLRMAQIPFISNMFTPTLLQWSKVFSLNGQPSGCGAMIPIFLPCSKALGNILEILGKGFWKRWFSPSQGNSSSALATWTMKFIFPFSGNGSCLALS